MLALRPATQSSSPLEDGQDWEVVVDVALREGTALDDLRALLEPIGTSLQIGDGQGVCRAHLRLPEGRQYEAIEGARGLGTVLRASLENLRAQVEELNRRVPMSAWPALEAEVLENGPRRCPIVLAPQ
jgi:dihydroxyacetone kinase-like predicted kinase